MPITKDNAKKIAEYLIERGFQAEPNNIRSKAHNLLAQIQKISIFEDPMQVRMAMTAVNSIVTIASIERFDDDVVS